MYHANSLFSFLFHRRTVLIIIFILSVSSLFFLLPAAGASHASHAPIQKVASHQAKAGLASTTVPNTLNYHNGSVMKSTSTIYAIFWEPPTLQDGTKTHVSANYNRFILNYFNDVGGSGLYNINTQYYDSTGNIVNSSTLGGSWPDTANYPPSGCTDAATPHGCISYTQIQTEIAHAISVNKWTITPTHLFFLFTAWGEGSCDSQKNCAFSGGSTPYCGFHYNFLDNNQTVLYANISYTATNASFCRFLHSPNNDKDADTTITWVSHEQMEAVTDPAQTGWYSDTNGNEIGDSCQNHYGSVNLDNGLANVQWKGHYYLVQEEWSNASSSCVLTYNTPAAHMQVTPGSVNLIVNQGTNPAPQTLTMLNTGGVLNWSLTSTLPSWLSVSPISGSLPTNASQLITLTFTLPSTPQTYTTTLLFSDPHANNSPFSVPISVVLNAVNRNWHLVTSSNYEANFSQLNAVAFNATTSGWAVGSYFNPNTNTSDPLFEYWDGPGGGWYVRPGPSVGSGGTLYGVSIVATSDVWAVGNYYANYTSQTLIEHWDGNSWSIIPSPNIGTGDNSLSAVTAVASNNVWAVGNYLNSSSGIYQTLIEHWDGSSWTIISSPNAGGYLNQLAALAATSASDIWAVGNYASSSTSNYQTLIEHWNGITWSVVSSPNVAGTNNALAGVTVVSSNDVWTVGSVSNNTLTEHWNGSTWNIVASPSITADFNQLNSIVSMATNNVWATGYHVNNATNLAQTLVEHWNGSQWSIVSSPNLGTDSSLLYGIGYTSASDVWIVGSHYNPNITQTLIEHWDGTSWTIAPSENGGPTENALNAVAAISANDVWAVGSYYSDVVSSYQTLTEHWNGTNWAVVSSPNASTTYDYLNAVATVSSSDVWAVGYELDTNVSDYQTLIEHWNGSSWSIIPSPNVGSTSSLLYGVTTITSSNVWAVGNTYNPNTGVYQSLIEHWDGSSWSIISSPNIGTGDSLLNVRAISATNVWAVGGYTNVSSSQALIEHWNGSSWSIITSPNVGSQSTLTAITAISATNIWAVGYYESIIYGPSLSLIEHWDGTSWTYITSPNNGAISVLQGIAATSATDISAVGYSASTLTSSDQTLIEHWNGSTWSVVSSPNVGIDDTLAGVTVVSPGNAWAVGSFSNTNNESIETLTEYYS